MSSGGDRHHDDVRRGDGADRAPRDLGLYIGGEAVDATSGETFTTANPATGEVLADVAARVRPMSTGRSHRRAMGSRSGRR